MKTVPIIEVLSIPFIWLFAYALTRFLEMVFA